MSNGVLAAPTSVPDVAASVYPIPRWSIERPLNVASPRTAFTVVVPASVPLPGSVAIATVTVLVAPTTVLPTASWMATTTAGLIATPATALLGWTVKASVGGGWVGPVSPPHATTASATATAAHARHASELETRSMGPLHTEVTDRPYRDRT